MLDLIRRALERRATKLKLQVLKSDLSESLSLLENLKPKLTHQQQKVLDKMDKNLRELIDHSLSMAQSEIQQSKNRALDILTEYIERLRELSRANGDAGQYRDVSAAVAHSLRNKFLAIGSLIKGLKEDATLSPDILESFEIIERSVEYSQILFRRMLDYLNLGKAQVELLDALQLLERTEFLARPFLSSSIRLRIITDKNLRGLSVAGNSEQLIGILLELIHNAGQAMRERNTGTVEIQVEKRNGVLAISVKDDGPGIPREIMKKLLKKPASSKAGLGLGLFLSNKVITALGGKLSLESSSRKGTTFTILLPVVIHKKDV